MTATDVSLSTMGFFVAAAAMRCAVAKVAAVAAVAADIISYVDASDSSNRRKPTAAHSETSESRRATRSSSNVAVSSDVRRRSCVDDCRASRRDRNVHVQAPKTIDVRTEVVLVSDSRDEACHDAAAVRCALTVDIRETAARRRAGGVEWANSSESVIDLIRLMAAARDCRIAMDHRRSDAKAKLSTRSCSDA